MEKTVKPVETLSFEEAMDEIEQITGQLTSGNLSLRDCVDNYQRGVALVKRCREELQAAREQIQTLQADVAGKPDEAAAVTDEADEEDVDVPY